jgi:tetratricopeptide (TPR) repeat protein
MTVLLLTLMLLSGACVGLYAFAFYQWHQAQAAVKDGRLEDAHSSLRFCLWVWPRSVPVHMLAARAARLNGDFDEADAQLKLCIKLEQGATEAIQVEFLLMRVQRGEEDEVGPELIALHVDKNSPESPLILETLARAYMHNLRYGPAYNLLTRWIGLAPNSAEPLRWRGWVLERLNDPEHAMKDYERALELEPDLVPVRLRMAEICIERKDPPKALVHLDRLRRLCPDRPEVMARMGECRHLQGNAVEARPLLEAAVQQLPNDSALLLHLAQLEMEQQHPAKAEQWARRALKVDATDTEAEFMLVTSLQAQERWAEAQAALEQHGKDVALLKRVAQVLQQEAEQRRPDPGALAELGVVFLRSQERVGLYWLHKALERDPGHQRAHEALAEYYEGKGDVAQAAAHRRYLKPQGKAAVP